MAIAVQGMRSFVQEKQSKADAKVRAAKFNPVVLSKPSTSLFGASRPPVGLNYGRNHVAWRSAIPEMNAPSSGTFSNAMIKPENDRSPLDAGTQLPRRAALATAAALAAGALSASGALAYPGEGTMTEKEVLEIAKTLTPFQRAISLQAATEPPFSGVTTNGYAYDNKEMGTYVGAISGTPIFDSDAKYDSGTGWPSFYEPVPGSVIERPDPNDVTLAEVYRGFFVRTEVIDAKSGAHLGHVFQDGPKPTGKRYCMNAGAMTFVPAEMASTKAVRALSQAFLDEEEKMRRRKMKW